MILAELAASDLAYYTLRRRYTKRLTETITQVMAHEAKFDPMRRMFGDVITEFFPQAFEMGFRDSGRRKPLERISDEDREWLRGRMEAELVHAQKYWMGVLAELFKQHPNDPRPILGYVKSLDLIYAQGKARADNREMLTFKRLRRTKESCATCLKLEGKRHSARWFAERNYIPAPGASFECHGYQCGHGLVYDDGKLFVPRKLADLQILVDDLYELGYGCAELQPRPEALIARGRALGIDLGAGFDPNQQRDAKGRWSKTGGDKLAELRANFKDDLSLPLDKRVEKLKPFIVEAAQKEYDAWEQNEEGVDEIYGLGGICDTVSQHVSSLAYDLLERVGARDGGADGDDHAWTVIYSQDHQQAVGVDIPPSVYESGGGYSWKKKAGVTITEADVQIFKINVKDLDWDHLYDYAYDPKQRRAPAGSPQGGRWISAETASGTIRGRKRTIGVKPGAGANKRKDRRIPVFSSKNPNPKTPPTIPIYPQDGRAFFSITSKSGYGYRPAEALSPALRDSLPEGAKGICVYRIPAGGIEVYRGVPVFNPSPAHQKLIEGVQATHEKFGFDTDHPRIVVADVSPFGGSVGGFYLPKGEGGPLIVIHRDVARKTDVFGAQDVEVISHELVHNARRSNDQYGMDFKDIHSGKIKLEEALTTFMGSYMANHHLKVMGETDLEWRAQAKMNMRGWLTGQHPYSFNVSAAFQAALDVFGYRDIITPESLEEQSFRKESREIIGLFHAMHVNQPTWETLEASSLTNRFYVAFHENYWKFMGEMDKHRNEKMEAEGLDKSLRQWLFAEVPYGTEDLRGDKVMHFAKRARDLRPLVQSIHAWLESGEYDKVEKHLDDLPERLADSFRFMLTERRGFLDPASEQAEFYSPDQPRSPKGSSSGGRWVKGSGGGGGQESIPEESSQSDLFHNSHALMGKGERLGGSSRGAKLYYLSGYGRVVYKGADNDEVRGEVNAFHLGELLGVEVPPTRVYGRHPEEKGQDFLLGTIQKFVPLGEATPSLLVETPLLDVWSQTQGTQAQRLALFDFVLGNDDRHDGNFLVDNLDGHPIAIDNGFGQFEHQRRLEMGHNLGRLMGFDGTKLQQSFIMPKTIREEWGRITREQFEAAMKKLTMNSKEVRDKAWANFERVRSAWGLELDKNNRLSYSQYGWDVLVTLVMPNSR